MIREVIGVLFGSGMRVTDQEKERLMMEILSCKTHRSILEFAVETPLSAGPIARVLFSIKTGWPNTIDIRLRDENGGKVVIQDEPFNGKSGVILTDTPKALEVIERIATGLVLAAQTPYSLGMLEISPALMGNRFPESRQSK